MFRWLTRLLMPDRPHPHEDHRTWEQACADTVAVLRLNAERELLAGELGRVLAENERLRQSHGPLCPFRVTDWAASIENLPADHHLRRQEPGNRSHEVLEVTTKWHAGKTVINPDPSVWQAANEMMRDSIKHIDPDLPQ
jgi:hypothetical protein